MLGFENDSRTTQYFILVKINGGPSHSSMVLESFICLIWRMIQEPPNVLYIYHPVSGS
jgi:hypothetical protein